jgi:hypothetical protein
MLFLKCVVDILYYRQYFLTLVAAPWCPAPGEQLCRSAYSAHSAGTWPADSGTRPANKILCKIWFVGQHTPLVPPELSTPILEPDLQIKYVLCKIWFGNMIGGQHAALIPLDLGGRFWSPVSRQDFSYSQDTVHYSVQRAFPNSARS